MAQKVPKPHKLEKRSWISTIVGTIIAAAALALGLWVYIFPPRGDQSSAPTAVPKYSCRTVQTLDLDATKLSEDKRWSEELGDDELRKAGRAGFGAIAITEGFAGQAVRISRTEAQGDNGFTRIELSLPADAWRRKYLRLTGLVKFENVVGATKPYHGAVAHLRVVDENDVPQYPPDRDTLAARGSSKGWEKLQLPAWLVPDSARGTMLLRLGLHGTAGAMWLDNLEIQECTR